MVIGIVGGGASGMSAALAAAQNPDAKVVLFERQARVGRKLLATGNGRCNLTNWNTRIEAYHGTDSEFARYALNAYGVQDTLNWFGSMGLYTVAEPSGRVYPYSDQANSVVDILRFSLDKPNIQVLTGCEVRRVHRETDGFSVEWTDGRLFCHKLIIACGGLAGTKLGGTMSGYQLLRSMGHHVTKLRPALVQLKSDWSGCVSLKGVRANCRAAVYHNGSCYSESSGELQFTEYGLSGPVVFEISRDACNGTGKWICCLDFLPDMTKEELLERLQDKKQLLLPAEELLTGILHNRLGRVLTAAAGIRGQRTLDSISEGELEEVCRLCKALEVNLTGTLGMDSAQVTAGGAVTEEFNSTTMESTLVQGLYACGEVLDIDGDCGGYNLQWAFSSGRLAGSSAGGTK